MAIQRVAQSIAAILILAPSTRAFAGERDCIPDTRRRARLVIQNNTPCPVAIYFGDRYQGRCESMTTLSLATKKTGEIVATARSRCDTWGPVTLNLRAGKTTRWTIAYEADGDERVDQLAAANSPSRRASGLRHHLEEVLSRHEDEERYRRRATKLPVECANLNQVRQLVEYGEALGGNHIDFRDVFQGIVMAQIRPLKP